MDLIVDERQRQLAHHVLSRLILGEHPTTGRPLAADSVVHEPDIMRALVVAFSCLPGPNSALEPRGTEPGPRLLQSKTRTAYTPEREQPVVRQAEPARPREIMIPVAETELRDFILERRIKPMNAPAQAAEAQTVQPAALPGDMAQAKVVPIPVAARVQPQQAAAQPVATADLPARSGEPWSTREDEKLVDRFGSGETLESIAAAHHRSVKSVSARLQRFKLL